MTTRGGEGHGGEAKELIARGKQIAVKCRGLSTPDHLRAD
jgi:hypothetical protein